MTGYSGFVLSNFNMGTQDTARQKIEWFRKRFDLMTINRISLNKEKLIAQFMIDNFSTRRKALEVINTFIVAGLVREFGGELASPELIKEEMSVSPEHQETLVRE